MNSGIGFRLRLGALCVFLLMFAAPKAHAVVLHGGDILVVDFVSDALIHIDPVTGAQTAISSGGDFVSLFGVAMNSNGDVFVMDRDAFSMPAPGAGGLFRIDTDTGAQNVISMRGEFSAAMGIAIAPNGDVVAANFFGDNLLAVDPVTGTQANLSADGLFAAPIGVVASGSDFFVTESDNQQVLRIDATTGAQSLISSAGFFDTPTGVAVESTGDLVVVSIDGGNLVRVDPLTGMQSLVAGGFTLPFGVAVEADGHLLVTDHDIGAFGPGRVIRVDPATGVKTTLSSGGLLGFPTGILVVPSNVGLPGDFDGDGVPDDTDLCPGTASGEAVGDSGCSASDMPNSMPPACGACGAFGMISWSMMLLGFVGLRTLSGNRHMGFRERAGM